MSDLLKREETWTISCHTNQLVSQLTYLNSKLTNTKDPECLAEAIKLMNKYEKIIKKYIK